MFVWWGWDEEKRYYLCCTLPYTQIEASQAETYIAASCKTQMYFEVTVGTVHS